MRKGLEVEFVLALPLPLIRTAAAVAILACLSTRIASETVQMATFYPAPSGVYTQMTTTGRTQLAEASGGVAIGSTFQPAEGLVVAPGAGNVGIGTTSPNDALEVHNRAAGGLLLSGTCPGVNLNGTQALGTGGCWGGGGGDVVLKSGGKVLLQSGSGASAISVAGNNVGIGVANPKAALEVGGGMSFTASCVPQSYAAGTPAAAGATCAAGKYATWATGLITNNQYGTVQSLDGSGQMLCCSCPVGGCPF